MFNDALFLNRETCKSLDQLDTGQKARIVSINLEDGEYLSELTMLGVAPYMQVSVFANHQSGIIFTIGSRTIAVDHATAAEILVQLV